LVTALFSTLWAAYAQPALAELLAVEVSAEGDTVTMGASIFTREQLETFIAATQALLAESCALSPGEMLTLYQPGLEGYISLSVYADADRPPFLLSLFAETPVAVESEWGVKALAVLLSETAAGLENTAALPDTDR
jgi:hypothetical protein